MKTAMALHIEDLHKIIKVINSKNLDKDLEETITETVLGCIENAESFLEKEKQQIIDAYNYGKIDGSDDDREGRIKSEKRYWKETFKHD